MQITYLYKCRACGAVDTAQTRRVLTNLDAAGDIINAMRGTPARHQAPEFWCFHDCSPSQVGIADLIGYKVEERKTTK